METFESGGISNLVSKIKAWANATFSKTDTKYPKAIKSITRSGTTFTATHYDDTTSTFTQQDNNTTYSAATQSADGLMSASDKTKLDGVATGANAYTHPTTSGNKHIPSGGSSGQFLKWSADGTATWAADNNTTYSTVSKTAAGLCPQLPNETTTTKYLRQDGTWVVPPDTNTQTITGVKGDSESSYRTGNVNLTAANIGAATSGHTHSYLPLSGGSLTGTLTFNKVNNAIAYTGSKATYNMIKFIDNTGDTYGNGISIGGGGLTIVGGGESNDTVAGQYANSGGNEILLLCSDGWVDVLTNCQDGYANRKTFSFASNGNLSIPGSITSGGTAVSLNGHTHSTTSKTAAGFCPALPNETTTTKYLRQDGTWVVPPNTNTTYSAGTGLSLSSTTFNISKVPVANGGTNSTTITGAADTLQVWSLGHGTAIPSNANLNSYMTIGNYHCAADATCQTLSNRPSGLANAFTLKVGYGTGTAYTCQTLIRYTDGRKWYRSNTTTSDTSKWGSWTEYAPNTNTTYSTVSKTAAGLCPQLPNETTTTKYLRQDGTWQVPPDNNTVYTHPTTSGNKHIPSGGSSGQILRWSADGTAAWGADNNTTYSTVSKTAEGLCPKLPNETTTTKYLRQDGTWVVPPNTQYATVSKTYAGLCPQLPNESTTTKYLRQDGTWQVPPDNNTVYTHPTTSGNKHIPSGGSSGQFLKWSADGTATWAADNNTTYSARSGYGIAFSGTQIGLGRTVLYSSSGNTGTVTLSASAANYNHMRVFAYEFDDSPSRFFTMDIYSPNGRNLCLGVVNASTSNVWVHARVVTISGTSISTNGSLYGQTICNNSANFDHSSKVGIWRVEAWNE